jgi:hypothetical protein
MAIVFNCPHCSHGYKLKDELAGKRATCKNPDCRQVITVPSPDVIRISDLGGIVPDDAPQSTAAPPVDAEAAALAALNETVQEKQDAEAERIIPMVCPHCDHKWTEAFEKAGKNVLCPNEECRQRIKVPIPKVGEKENWRSTASGKPSLAKENFEKPADVVDAEAKVVSKDAWVRGGGTEHDYEPVPFKHKLKIAALIATPILLIVGGIWAIVSWRGEVREEVKFDKLVAEFETARGELDPAQACLGAAILEMAAGEDALDPRNREKDQALQQAATCFTKARTEIREAGTKDPQGKAAAERYALAGELALVQLGLGGTDEEVKENARYRWEPNAPGNRPLRVNEKVHTVHQELQQTLGLLNGSDFDTRAVVIRRLARELGKKGQPDLALNAVSFCFSDAEQPEAKAIVALELWKPARGGAAPQRAGDELKAQLAGGAVGRSPTPASAQTLWQVAGTDKAPTMFAPPGGQVSEPSRYAYVGTYLLKDEPQKALDLAKQQGGALSGQLRALALHAEWASDPGPAFDSALSAVNLASKAKKEAPPNSVLLRLSQLAASVGRADQSKQLAALIPDEGAKTWARGSAIQFAATKENKSKLEDGTMDYPDDPKKLRAGHFWARYWTGRQNARANEAEAKKAINLWPVGTAKPFGMAGIAMAQHDK